MSEHAPTEGIEALLVEGIEALLAEVEDLRAFKASHSGDGSEDDLTRYDEAAAKMRDPERYAELRALTHEDRHPCPIKGCNLAAEEHHRLAYGYLSENLAMRRRIAELEGAQP